MEKNISEKQKIIAKYVDILETNAAIFAGFHYAYIGSISIYFQFTTHLRKPNDCDIAFNWNGKTIQDFYTLYKRIVAEPRIKELTFKAIYAKTYNRYNIGSVQFRVKKGQELDVRYVPSKILAEIVESGNLVIEYKIDGLEFEIFLESKGNGLTNLGVMNKKIIALPFKNSQGKEVPIPVLSASSLAENYSINFVREIMWNSIFRYNTKSSKPKDGMRIFIIMYLLEKDGQDIKPKDLLVFIEKTIAKYSELDRAHVSKYVSRAIEDFPEVKVMFQKIVDAYEDCKINENAKDILFVDFFKLMQDYKLKIEPYNQYAEDMPLGMMADTTSKTNEGKDGVAKEQKVIIKDKKIIKDELNSILEDIKQYGIKKKNKSFAYFYEIYMVKHFFIKQLMQSIAMKDMYKKNMVMDNWIEDAMQYQTA